MSDYISREAALDAINSYLRLSEMSKTMQNSITIQEIIASLPSATPYTEEELQRMQDLELAEIWKAYEIGVEEGKPRWIPVTKQLPVSVATIIVTVDDGKRTYTDIGWYWGPNDVWFTDDESVNVTAWMPLPEPWKGERE